MAQHIYYLPPMYWLFVFLFYASRHASQRPRTALHSVWGIMVDARSYSISVDRLAFSLSIPAQDMPLNIILISNFRNNGEQRKIYILSGTTWNNKEAFHMKIYKASKSTTKGRKSWAMIFRHPVRKDLKGIGLRIRRGLGTSDPKVADELVADMNDLLANESLWNLDAKPQAEKLYNQIIVKAFYDSLETPPRDYWAIREDYLPLPSLSDGYTRVLLIGATGAGKTTLIRQFIGSDPTRDKFPSTSTSRCTVSDTEVIMADGHYKTIVTFFSEAEIRILVEESVVQAVFEADESGKIDRIANCLLEHKEQRFRLRYILGNYKIDDDYLEDAVSDSDIQESQEHEIPLLDVDNLNDTLESYTQRIIDIVNQTREKLNKQFDSKKDKNQEESHELFEKILLEQEDFGILLDDIMDEIIKRFDFVQDGSTERDRGDWPQYWRFETDDRDKFIKSIRQFSSNYAPMFGRLLTPIVQGIRVQGPLYPDTHSDNWTTEHPKLVLMDGEGLGHTPDSANYVPPSLIERFDKTDVILLVDNAKQPILASSISVLKSVCSRGHQDKLTVAFTHFDVVKADDLPNSEAKKNHILNMLRNGLESHEDILAPSLIRNLERELEIRCFFLGGLDKFISEDMKFTRKEMQKLLETIQSTHPVFLELPPKPIYDYAYLSLVIQRATKAFHERWNAILGFSYSADVRSEHWSRIKALSRRIVELRQNHYYDLNPTFDLSEELIDGISFYLDNPVNWEPKEPSEQEKREITNAVRKKISRDLSSLSHEEVIKNRFGEWDVAYWYRGIGSTRLRARDIQTIFNKGAPLFRDVTPPGSYEFIDCIKDIIENAIESVGESENSSA